MLNLFCNLSHETSTQSAHAQIGLQHTGLQLTNEHHVFTSDIKIGPIYAVL